MIGRFYAGLSPRKPQPVPVIRHFDTTSPRVKEQNLCPDTDLWKRL